jgi:hypothetical protein
MVDQDRVGCGDHVDAESGQPLDGRQARRAWCRCVEHAYYPKYQNRRPDYLAAWWNTVNWAEVETRFNASVRPRVGQVSRPRRASTPAISSRTWTSGADVDVCPTKSNLLATSLWWNTVNWAEVEGTRFNASKVRPRWGAGLPNSAAGVRFRRHLQPDVDVRRRRGRLPYEI